MMLLKRTLTIRRRRVFRTELQLLLGLNKRRSGTSWRRFTLRCRRRTLRSRDSGRRETTSWRLRREWTQRSCWPTCSRTPKWTTTTTTGTSEVVVNEVANASTYIHFFSLPLVRTLAVVTTRPCLGVCPTSDARCDVVVKYNWWYKCACGKMQYNRFFLHRFLHSFLRFNRAPPPISNPRIALESSNKGIQDHTYLLQQRTFSLFLE
mmetsp:Transcript_26/g.41  ORF Transcript_26/g.41 Transcript_26/m.41 type:complete len:207 (+) Transcript_26:602-1222(+)